MCFHLEILYFIFILYIIALALIFWFYAHKRKKSRVQIKGLAKNTLEMTPEEYFTMRNAKF